MSPQGSPIAGWNYNRVNNIREARNIFEIEYFAGLASIQLEK